MSTRMESTSNDEALLRALYRRLLTGWNQRSAVAMAAAFEEDGEVVGFDGSQMHGRAEIEAELARIFTHHPTPPYIGKVKGVRLLSPEVAIVNAVAGMVPPGQSNLDPKLNTIQTLVTRRRDGEWRIALFENTPAQFHGRPELVEKLTDELRQSI